MAVYNMSDSSAAEQTYNGWAEAALGGARAVASELTERAAGGLAMMAFRDVGSNALYASTFAAKAPFVGNLMTKSAGLFTGKNFYAPKNLSRKAFGDATATLFSQSGEEAWKAYMSHQKGFKFWDGWIGMAGPTTRAADFSKIFRESAMQYFEKNNVAYLNFDNPFNVFSANSKSRILPYLQGRMKAIGGMKIGSKTLSEGIKTAYSSVKAWGSATKFAGVGRTTKNVAKTIGKGVSWLAHTQVAKTAFELGSMPVKLIGRGLGLDILVSSVMAKAGHKMILPAVGHVVSNYLNATQVTGMIELVYGIGSMTLQGAAAAGREKRKEEEAWRLAKRKRYDPVMGYEFVDTSVSQANRETAVMSIMASSQAQVEGRIRRNRPYDFYRLLGG